MKIRSLSLCAVAVLAASLFTAAQPASGEYFKIRVVDEDTGRGIPLVTVTAPSNAMYVTDSSGLVAFYEPGLMDQDVWISFESHGYEHPKNLLGIPAETLHTSPGGQAVVKMKRLNIAERLYRVTGAGIYRDSVLLDEPAPLKHPLLNAEVTGQDSAIVVPFKDKLFWVWGDTNGISGMNFHTTAATSEWPGKGGLDPGIGVDLSYFTNEDGFTRRMYPFSEPGLVWTAYLVTLPDETGAERLYSFFIRVKGLDGVYEWGYAVFNEEKQEFERLKSIPIRPDTPQPNQHVFRVQSRGRAYYCNAALFQRFAADRETLLDPSRHESFTCLVPGGRYDSENPPLERDASGQPVYAWKKDTDPLTFDRQAELVDKGKIKKDESLSLVTDVDTGREMKPYPGSVYYNPYHRCWIMLYSLFGDVWFAEADTVTGPWVYAKKIVTHNDYTFYNIVQHPYFDQEGGRRIYFEGTYTKAFSASKVSTPQYEYNQIMYRLDLDDPRLVLPQPVYRIQGPDGVLVYGMRDGIEAGSLWSKIHDSPFYAIPPNRKAKDFVPVFCSAGRLSTDRSLSADNEPPLFCALPSDTDIPSNPSVVPLYEYFHPETNRYRYSTEPGLETAIGSPPPSIICRVWRNPQSVLILDPDTQPVLYPNQTASDPNPLETHR